MASAATAGWRRRASEALRIDDLRAQWRRLPRRVRGPAIPAIVILLAFLYPYYRSWLPNIPIFGEVPSVDTGVTMLIYMMMAIGLNIVVGYAGLLDLGYVAFYAMGAYTAAWFA